MKDSIPDMALVYKRNMVAAVALLETSSPLQANHAKSLNFKITG